MLPCIPKDVNETLNVNQRYIFLLQNDVFIDVREQLLIIAQRRCVDGIPTSTYSNMTSVVSLAGLTLVYC